MTFRGWRIGMSMGTNAVATPIPASPYILPFYNDPTYGVVLYPYNLFNPATVQLYRISDAPYKPNGLIVELIGDPISFATTGSSTGSGQINGNEQILPLDNHIVFTAAMTAAAAGKPFDFSSWGLGVLTRSGESISFNFPAGQVRSLATDFFFNHGDGPWMVRVGPDALARGYGLSLGDGTVPATGNLGSVVDGITIGGGGAASIVSHTPINYPLSDPNWNLQGGVAVPNPGEFAMILGYDGSRLFGVKDYAIPTPGPFSYPWTLGGGATGAGKVIAADTSGWAGVNRPNYHGAGFPTIEGTALGVLMHLGSGGGGEHTGVLGYSDGGSVALGSPPTVAGWPLQDDPGSPGYFSIRWGSEAILAPPSFGNYATFKAYPNIDHTSFTIKYALTAQSGTSFSAVIEADTAITTANYPAFQDAPDVISAARHTANIVVLGLVSNGEYFLEAVSI